MLHLLIHRCARALQAGLKADVAESYKKIASSEQSLTATLESKMKVLVEAVKTSRVS
jgi:hypothetical protein